MHGKARNRNSAAAKRLAQALKNADNAKTPKEADAALEQAFEVAKLADVDGFTTAERREFQRLWKESRA